MEVKSFGTTGEGPEGLWRTPEERWAGEEALLREFAETLERTLAGRRGRFELIMGVVTSSMKLMNLWRRIRWEYVGSFPTTNTLHDLLRRIEGPQHRFNRRWSKVARSMLWGFDPRP